MILIIVERDRSSSTADEPRRGRVRPTTESVRVQDRDFRTRGTSGVKSPIVGRRIDGVGNRRKDRTTSRYRDSTTSTIIVASDIALVSACASAVVVKPSS